MKLFLTIAVYLLLAAVLGYGILRAVQSAPWLLIVSFAAYAVAFAKIGCLPKKASH